jgi:hypothetical protein
MECEERKEEKDIRVPQSKFARPITSMAQHWALAERPLQMVFCRVERNTSGAAGAARTVPKPRARAVVRRVRGGKCILRAGDCGFG